MQTSSVQRRFNLKLSFGDSDSEIFACKYDNLDKFIACGYGDGAIRVYDSKSGKCTNILCYQINSEGKSDDMPVTDLRWRPTNK